MINLQTIFNQNYNYLLYLITISLLIINILKKIDKLKITLITISIILISITIIISIIYNIYINNIIKIFTNPLINNIRNKIIITSTITLFIGILLNTGEKET